ncbi:hypothetical protein EON65_57870 [archaeon]|nr:MAG: hypothetical protein EON65_57870 [archaeon]
MVDYEEKGEERNNLEGEEKEEDIQDQRRSWKFDSLFFRLENMMVDMTGVTHRCHLYLTEVRICHDPLPSINSLS